MEPQLECSGEFYGSLPYFKYRLPGTDLTITISTHEGPMIGAKILFKTLTDTEEGLPHTLEHLVFMGSDKYPKGFLDFAASRCLSGGTNAWTAQDHTCYTVTCAGQEGFLNFLPIFLDHILFPVLTPQTFTTEVYHLNGKGEDGGVVYCEMQSYEMTMDNIAEREFCKAMWGDGTPYSVETGGMLHDLRTTCTFEKCRDYHRENYRPDNLNIIIHGMVDIGDLCRAIEPLHQKLLNTKYPARTENIAPVAPMPRDEMKEVTVKFPAPDDADPGCVLMGFQSRPLSDIRGILAEDFILGYLTDTPASPLTKALVHAAEPYCSSVQTSRYEYPINVIQLYISNSDVSRHTEIRDLLFSTIHDVIRSGIDLDRIRSIVENTILREKQTLENCKAGSTADAIILDHLYGGGYLSSFGDIENTLQSLMEEEGEFWVTTLADLTRNPLVCVYAVPSEEMDETSKQEDEERVEKRKEELGDTKLAECGKILEEAEAFNKPKIPDSLFEELAHPDKQRFSDLDTSTLYTGVPNLPPTLYLHSINSSFYRFVFLIDTDRFSAQEKPLISLMLRSFCSLPVKDGDTTLTGDEVAAQREELFLTTDMTRDGEMIKLSFTFKPGNLERCLEFLRRALFHQVAEESRISEYIQKLVKNIKKSKRDGETVMHALELQHLYPYSTASRCSIFNLEQALSAISVTEAAATVQSILGELMSRDAALHIAASQDSLESLDTDRLIEMFKLGSACPNFVTIRSFQNPDMSSLMENDIVAHVPGEESSYCVAVIPVPELEIYTPLYVKLMVLKDWWSQLDGVVGLETRGKGLSYGFYTLPSGLQASIASYLTQSTDINKAYSAVKGVVGRIAEEEDLVTDIDVDLARSGAFVSVVSGLSSPVGRVGRQMKKIHIPGFDVPITKISEMVDSVTKQDIVELLTKRWRKNRKMLRRWNQDSNLSEHWPDPILIA
eukprot:sb/3461736/